jgi:hypothetical protein
MPGRSVWIRWCCVVLVMIPDVLLLSGCSRSASAAEAPDTVLLQATDLAEQGRDGDVVQLLRPFVDQGVIAPAERATALNLLGRSYVHIGATASADSMFLLLARTDRAWKPTIKAYLDDQELASAMRGYRRAHPGIVGKLTVWRHPWYRDAKTYVYPAVVAALIILWPKPPKTVRDPLPDPPPPPSRNSLLNPLTVSRR